MARKKLIICDGCGKEYPGQLLGLKLHLAHRHSDIADPNNSYDFCSYYCLGLWLYRSGHRYIVEQGIADKGVSSR